MSYQTSTNQFQPNYLVHPGSILVDELDGIGMPQSELAKRTGLTNKTINAIVKGNAPISPDTAVSFETVLGRPAVYWLKLDAIFQVGKANKAKNAALESNLAFLEEINHKEMIREGWITKKKDKVSLLKELFSFFGIASEKQLLPVWDRLEVNYRTSLAYKKSHINIMAWLRRGEKLAHAIHCEPFDTRKFKNALLECRKLTTKTFPEVEKKIQSICAAAGVAVVYVPVITGVSTSGAAQWLDKDKALIQLSLRGKRDDKFWFNFYHEAGHILLHGRKEQFIDTEGKTSSSVEGQYLTEENKLKEAEADEFSANFLIARKSFSTFAAYDDFSESAVKSFARKEGIAPGIVVGQLQKNSYIGWGELNSLKQKYEFAS